MNCFSGISGWLEDATANLQNLVVAVAVASSLSLFLRQWKLLQRSAEGNCSNSNFCACCSLSGKLKSRQKR